MRFNEDFILYIFVVIHKTKYIPYYLPFVMKHSMF